MSEWYERQGQMQDEEQVRYLHSWLSAGSEGSNYARIGGKSHAPGVGSGAWLKHEQAPAWYLPCGMLGHVGKPPPIEPSEMDAEEMLCEHSWSRSRSRQATIMLL